MMCARNRPSRPPSPIMVSSAAPRLAEDNPKTKPFLLCYNNVFLILTSSDGLTRAPSMAVLSAGGHNRGPAAEAVVPACGGGGARQGRSPDLGHVQRWGGFGAVAEAVPPRPTTHSSSTDSAVHGGVGGVRFVCPCLFAAALPSLGCPLRHGSSALF